MHSKSKIHIKHTTWIILVNTKMQEEIEDTTGVIRIRKIEEEQTTQWPKEKGQKDKQQSTKHTHRTKDRVTRTPL